MSRDKCDEQETLVVSPVGAGQIRPSHDPQSCAERSVRAQRVRLRVESTLRRENLDIFLARTSRPNGVNSGEDKLLSNQIARRLFERPQSDRGLG